MTLRVVRQRVFWFSFSGLLAVIALASLLLQGLNFGVDFRGGVLMDVRFAEPRATGDVRQVLASQGLGLASIRQVGTDGREFLITAPPMAEEEQQALLSALRQRLGTLDVRNVEAVSPVVGAELRRAALAGVALATVAMLAYIAVRFEWRFGVAAVVALLHDVFLTVGFFSVFRLPVDVSFVAAVLTVFGYSINDTIIVFDRIRENLQQRRKESLEDLVDRSVNETLRRSINTSLTTILAIAAVYALGGRTVQPFALALMVGIAFGAYSSIFVASPLYVVIAQRSRRAVAGSRAA
ncbi:MAG: protein translocase subunit SecF [Clostridia bacterium]|nr:protein translocase subunit SecF [Clostridia bacterium]